MVKTILLIFLLLFSVLGLCEAIYFLRMIFYHPGTLCNGYLIIVLKKECALKQLNYIWQKIKWQGDMYACGIIAIIDFLDVEEILCCNSFVNDKNIVLCDKNALVQCKFLQGDFLNGNR